MPKSVLLEPVKMGLDCFQMGYGMTEISIVFISFPEDTNEERAGAVGVVVDHVEVRDDVTYGSKRWCSGPYCNVNCC